MATHKPDAEFLLTAAKEQLQRHLAPLVFEYFEWSIDDDLAGNCWTLRGDSHSRVELHQRMPSVREYEAEMRPATFSKPIEYYYPKPFHIAMRFEKHHENLEHLKAAFDGTVAGMVNRLKFLGRANDIQELEAWIILAQKPL